MATKQIDSTARIVRVRLQEQAGDPAAPAAGYWYLYVKADGISIEDDAANVARLMEEGDAAGGDLSGTYPNPSVVNDSHNHTALTLPATMPPSGHNVLDSTYHGDVLTGAVARGALIVGNATPKWAALPIGAANKILQSDGTDTAWSAGTIVFGGAASSLVLPNATTTVTGGGTLALGGYALTMPESLTVAGRNVANTFSAKQSVVFSSTTDEVATISNRAAGVGLYPTVGFGESGVANGNLFFHSYFGGTAEEAPMVIATNYEINGGVKGVTSWWGYNTYGDTQKIVAGVPHMHQSFEANYYIGGKHYFEFNFNIYNGDNSKAVRAWEFAANRDDPSDAMAWTFRIGKAGNAFFRISDYDDSVKFDLNRATGKAQFNLPVGINTAPATNGLDVVGGIRSQTYSNPTSGTGLEIGWDGTNGLILSIDRSAAAWQPLRINAQYVGINKNPGVALDVAGNIQASSSINAMAGNIQLNYLLSTYCFYSPGNDIGFVGYRSSALVVDMQIKGATGNVLIGTTTDGLTTGGSLAIAKDLAHRGTKATFYNGTLVIRGAALTAADASAVNSGDATTDAVINNMRTRINELEARLNSATGVNLFA